MILITHLEYRLTDYNVSLLLIVVVFMTRGKKSLFMTKNSTKQDLMMNKTNDGSFGTVDEMKTKKTFFIYSADLHKRDKQRFIRIR